MICLSSSDDCEENGTESAVRTGLGVGDFPFLAPFETGLQCGLLMFVALIIAAMRHFFACLSKCRVAQ